MKWLLLVLAVGACGCMSPMQTLTVTAYPADAVLRADGASCTGSGFLVLKRDVSMALIASAPGCTQATIHVTARVSGGRLTWLIIKNILLAPLTLGFSVFVGIPVSLSDGSIWVLEPESLEYSLKPE